MAQQQPKEDKNQKLVVELSQLSVYKIIDKFLVDEQAFTRTLRTFNEFEIRLRCHFDQQDHILLMEDIDSIFISTGSIYNFSKDLIESLNKKRWDGPEQFLLEVGDILVKSIQFFKMYGQYNLDVKGAVERFTYLMENNSKFKRWVDFNEIVAAIKPGTFLQLLRLPQQHFPTYTIYLSAMVDALAQLSTDHPATASIVNARTKFAEVMESINISAENNMRANRVVEIQKIYFKDSVILVEASRKWYRSSKIKIKDVKENKKQVDAILFLFNDCVVYATSAFFGGYNLTGVMSIAGLQIQPLTGLPNSFKLISQLTNREWEITCINNENPDQRRLEQKETAERSYFQWLGALLKVYKLFYNIQDGSSRQQQGAATTLSTRVLHPDDTFSMMNKKNVAAPRQVEKPSPSSQEAAQSEFDRRQRDQPARGHAATVASPTPQQPTAAAPKPSPNLTVAPPSTPSSAAAPPHTPRRAAPVPHVPHLTDDEIRASIAEGTKLNDWEKVLDPSSGQFYYENLPLETTTWDEPEEFLALFNQLRADNDAAQAAQAAAAAAPPAAPPATPAATPRPPNMPPATPSAPTPMPPTTGPPATPAGPPAMPQGGPPAMPPTTPAGPPVMPPSGPPSGPGGRPPMGGLLGAIQGGATLRKVSDAEPSSAPAPPRNNLLAGIQGGVQLKKAEAKEEAPPPATNNAGGLMAALANYRKFVQDDDDKDDDDDDDDWN